MEQTVAFVCEGSHQAEEPENRLDGDNILAGMRESLVKTHSTCGVDGRCLRDEDHGAHHLAVRNHRVEYFQRSKEELVTNDWNRDIHQRSGLKCWDECGALDVDH